MEFVHGPDLEARLAMGYTSVFYIIASKPLTLDTAVNFTVYYRP
jgi:hypothetical protein